MKLWPLFFYILFLTKADANWLFSQKRIVKNNLIPSQLDTDYSDQLKSLKSVFLKTYKADIRTPSRRVKKYLKKVTQKIKDNNETFLPNYKDAEFYFIKNSSPFIFSLPGYKIFISTGLMKEYIKNESIFLGALTYEIVKSGREIYRKKEAIPKGFIRIKSILKKVNVEGDMRTNLFKWTFLAMRRSGFDGGAVLGWIQTINRNSTKFSWHLVGKKNLSLEEFKFKTFLVAQGVGLGEVTTSNSSKGFYRLKKWMN